MKYSKLIVFLLALPLLAFNSWHKYYISVTEISYVQEKQSVQIITRIFLDDLETLLRERYDETITLDEEDESATTNMYITRYLSDKFKIKINGKESNFKFIGKKYDLDVMKCYIEIENVKDIKSMEISNKILFDMFEDQQNIIKTKIYSKQKSFVLTAYDTKCVLNFN